VTVPIDYDASITCRKAFAEEGSRPQTGVRATEYDDVLIGRGRVSGGHGGRDGDGDGEELRGLEISVEEKNGVVCQDEARM
jgi:hypothetical protein